MLAAARLAGVDEVYRVGGAQAIAALAYGTETRCAGRRHCRARQRVRHRSQAPGRRPDVGIDGWPGPSDVAIVADGSVRRCSSPPICSHRPNTGPAVAARDHVGRDARAVVERQLRHWSRRRTRRRSRSDVDVGGRAILVDGPEQALDAANAIAPEHLQLMCADAECSFRSCATPVPCSWGVDGSAVLGDYAAGVNHVLPTGATARFASALQVADFQKHIHVVRRPRALTRVAPYVTAIAETEGLSAHATRSGCARSRDHVARDGRSRGRPPLARGVLTRPRSTCASGSTPTRARTRRPTRSYER